MRDCRSAAWIKSLKIWKLAMERPGSVVSEGPAVVTTSVPGSHVPVELVTAAAARSLTAVGEAANATALPIYVESTPGDLSSVVVSSGNPAAGLQLTTITVAVPAPLSPTDPAFLAAHAAANQPPPPPTVALPQVPAPQECTFKWKYEQNKEKTGSSLVRSRTYRGNVFWYIQRRIQLGQ